MCSSSLTPRNGSERPENACTKNEKERKTCFCFIPQKVSFSDMYVVMYIYSRVYRHTFAIFKHRIDYLTDWLTETASTAGYFFFTMTKELMWFLILKNIRFHRSPDMPTFMLDNELSKSVTSKSIIGLVNRAFDRGFPKFTGIFGAIFGDPWASYWIYVFAFWKVIKIWFL